MGTFHDVYTVQTVLFTNQKPTHHRKLSAFLRFQKTSYIMIISCFPHEDQKAFSQGLVLNILDITILWGYFVP